MTTISVVFLTYTPTMEHPRAGYADKCFRSLLSNLSFKEGELRWHIADDGSPEGHRQHLVDIAAKHGVRSTVSNSHRLGYGGNMNHAYQAVHDVSDIVLACEEDWELIRPFDLSLLAQALQANEDIRCIRLGYLGITGTLVGRVVFIANQTFLLFDPESDETFVFTGHPRLETVKYEQLVGAWPEGLKAGYTEVEVCKRLPARMGVAWPLDAGINANQDYCTLFAHIGGEQAE